MIEPMNEIYEFYQSVPDFNGIKIENINSRSMYGDQLIHLACISGRLNDVKVLLNMGADVNSSGENGMTPLHYAVEQGHVDIVMELIKNCADASFKNEDGITPAGLAELVENMEILKYFQQIKLY